MAFAPTPGPGPGGRLDARCIGGAGRGVPIGKDEGVGGIRPVLGTPGVKADKGPDDEEAEMMFVPGVRPVMFEGNVEREEVGGTPAAVA